MRSHGLHPLNPVCRKQSKKGLLEENIILTKPLKYYALAARKSEFLDFSALFRLIFVKFSSKICPKIQKKNKNQIPKVCQILLSFQICAETLPKKCWKSAKCKLSSEKMTNAKVSSIFLAKYLPNICRKLNKILPKKCRKVEKSEFGFTCSQCISTTVIVNI